MRGSVEPMRDLHDAYAPFGALEKNGDNGLDRLAHGIGVQLQRLCGEQDSQIAERWGIRKAFDAPYPLLWSTSSQ